MIEAPGGRSVPTAPASMTSNPAFSLPLASSPSAQSAVRVGGGKNFLPHVPRLRGVAILLIVTGHCVGHYAWADKPVFGAFLQELFQNSSVLFMFVAGYLFQHLSKSFHFQSYLFKKVENVFLPYVLFATPAIAFALHHGQDLLEAHPDLQGTSLVYRIGWLYINGGATINYALWYIPVIAIYYLAAPLFLFVDRRPYLYHSLWLLIPLSTVAHRPTYTGGHDLQLALYFLSSYVLGMYCSHYGTRALDAIRRYSPWLLAAYLTILFAHTFGASHHGNDQVQQLFSFQYGYIDWLFLQKMLLSVMLLGWLPKFNQVSLPRLDYIADVSFTIFFVHVYLLFLLVRANHSVKSEGSILSLVVLIAAVVTVSCLVAYGARRLFGKRSRLLVGS